MRSMLFVCLCLWAHYSFGQTLHFVSIEHLVEQEIGTIVLPQIYQKLGITITITPLPGLRAEHQAATGKVDGEVMQIYTYGNENPNLIRIPTPYFELETMTFTKADRGIQINSKAELANYSVAKIRGVKHTNNITVGLKDVTDVDSTSALIKLVNDGLVDVALTNTIDGMLAIHQLNLESVVVPGSEALARLNLYHYLNREHQYLAEKVDAVIREMKTTGELDILIQQATLKILKDYQYEAPANSGASQIY